MVEKFGWLLFAAVVTFQQQENYAVTYQHWPLVIAAIRKPGIYIEGERSNFGGFDDINDWFKQRDLDEF